MYDRRWRCESGDPPVDCRCCLVCAVVCIVSHCVVNVAILYDACSARSFISLGYAARLQDCRQTNLESCLSRLRLDSQGVRFAGVS